MNRHVFFLLLSGSMMGGASIGIAKDATLNRQIKALKTEKKAINAQIATLTESHAANLKGKSQSSQERLNQQFEKITDILYRKRDAKKQQIRDLRGQKRHTHS